MAHPSGWAIRQTTSDDVAQVSRLIASARWKHLHLDWIQPEGLAGRAPFLLAWEGRHPRCAIGCPPFPPEVAWIRVFAVVSGADPGACWEALWGPARNQLRQLQTQRAAALIGARWMEPLLTGSGFQLQDEVIFMEHRLGQRLDPPTHPGRLRHMQPADLAQLLVLDWRAFGQLWQFSPETLPEALAAAAWARLVEVQGKPVGYQITTESPYGAHLARLAVEPTWQGRGLGRALVIDALHWVEQRGLDLLSVNTQAGNAPSRRLYRSLGFVESGQVFPVYVSTLQPASVAGP